MADLAAAAGMSRPALYQYFGSRADVFRAAMRAVLTDACEQALAALERDVDLAERIDGYLQAAFGTPHRLLASAAHGDEIIDAKSEFAADIAAAVNAERRRGLESFLRRRCALRGKALADVVGLVDLAPIGLKSDEPTPDVYRRRLGALARSAAALIESAGEPTPS